MCLPNRGGWEGQEEPYRVFSQLMGQDLQADTPTTQDAAHLTGTSPFHDLLGLLLPHAALRNRLEQPAHRSKAMVGAFMAANGCCDSTKNSRFNCFRDIIFNDFVVRLYSLLNFWSTVNKLMVPELKGWIFDQLNERDKETPGMRPIYNQSFQENPEIQK